MIDIDEYCWMAGQYNLRAFSVVIDQIVCGITKKRSTLKYYDSPVLKEESLSDEEKEKIAMEREISSMEQWIRNDKARGLPETKIK